MTASRTVPLRRWALLLLPALAACADLDGIDRSFQAATTCPESIRFNARNEPVGVSSGKIRYCWPNEAACYCDSWGDCYALSGYIACTPPSATDAGTDAVSDARIDAATDATSDTATDAVGDARIDAATDATSDTGTDAVSGVGVCPEAVRTNGRGEPVGVVSGKVRYCWPGMMGCVCDAWGDCYAGEGYVACSPPSATDATTDATTDAVSDVRTDVTSDATSDATSDVRTDATTDATSDVRTDATTDATSDVRTDAVSDAGADATSDLGTDAASGVGICPEAVRMSERGEPVGVVSGKVRYCWPGMANCTCDAWGDCYAQEDYVPCTPPPPPPTGPASTTPPPPTDPVTYTGTLPTALGQRVSTLTVAGLARTVYSYVPSNRATRPPLVIAYHGTDLWGDQMLANMDVLTFAEQNGVVVLAPDARYQDAAHADFNRPAGNARYWETAYNTNPDTNPDLLLTRALIKEATRALNIDIDRVYVVGFSNGGFMALTASVVLRERIAGFAESSAGLVPCATRPECTFRGTSLSCATLRTQVGYCSCTGPDKPIALPTTGGRPGFLWHAPEDTTVSVYYTCTLDARMTSLGIPHRVQLWSGEHYVTSSFMPNAWAYLRAYVR